ncbi:MAG: hypothetical protein PVG66_06580 [Chromatiales bacterium]|jgi:hypothetical protein
MKLTIIKTVLAGMLMTGLMACEQQGPAEKAGEKIDETIEKAGEQLEQAGDEIRDKTDS